MLRLARGAGCVPPRGAKEARLRQLLPEGRIGATARFKFRAKLPALRAGIGRASAVANADSADRRCAACGRELPPQRGRGRVRLYCDASCRSKARRNRANVNIGLTNPDREGNLDSVPEAASGNTRPALSRVIAAARLALDDVPADAALTPLETVAVVRSLARVVEDGMREAVLLARQAGNTWAQIGELLGTTRQAAFQRFGRPPARQLHGGRRPVALRGRGADRTGQLRPVRAGRGPVLPEPALNQP
jgi:hypothetical protein